MVATPATRTQPRRHLRLKEWAPASDRMMRPALDYLAATDGSLPDAEYRLRTDADGFILPPAAEGADQAFDETIVFFGDSFVESVYVPEGQRFPAAVQAALAAAGIGARCLNAGYSGATTLHMLLALIGKIGRRPQTTVVFVVPSNDALALVKKGGFWCREDKRYTPIVPVPEGSEASAQPLDLNDLKAALNLYVDACKRLRLGLILATFPHRTAEHRTDPWLARRFRIPANYARLLEWRSAVNGVARGVAQRVGLPFVDLDALISTRTELFYDDLHMNAAGSARVAEIFADALLARRRGAQR